MLVLWHNKYLNLFYVCSAFHRRHELFINDDEICSECFFFGSYYFRRRILWCILFPLSVIFFLSSLWFLECSEKRKKKPRERLIRVSDLTLCSFPNLKILMGKPTSKAKTVVPHRPESRLVPCDRLV